MVRALCSIISAWVLLAACDEAATPLPTLELYIDGTAQGLSPSIGFPEIPAGGDGLAVQIEIKNLGPGDLELTSSPAIQIERDDRLAFRVTQPPTTRYARGESLTFSIIFAPHSAGTSAARAVITTKAPEPIIITLSGIATTTSAPAALIATIDGAPIDEVFDFGTVPTAESKPAQLRLSNVGATTLSLGSNPVSIVGPDASMFTLVPSGATSIEPNAHVDMEIAFLPTGCRAYGATMTIQATGVEPVSVELSGRGGENPQGHADVIIDADLLETPDFDVALSAPVGAGKRRFAVGNMAAGTYTGRVTTYTWDGCVLDNGHDITPAGFGLNAALFGKVVSFTDDGSTLLVTAKDNTKDAWLFSIGADHTPRYLATLATFDQAGGHGRGAAIAGNGTAAFIGQERADTANGNAHGAVFAYERQGGTWQSMPEAKLRLTTSVPNQTELIGSSVAASASGDVVVSGALATPAGAQSKGPATAYVWASSEDPAGGRLWGKPVPSSELNQRMETVKLTSAQVPTEGGALVAISADGHTIVMSIVVNSEVQIRVYTRADGNDLWGLNTASLNERSPTALLRFTASPNLRLAVGPTGQFIIVADQSGAREIAKPGLGWKDESPLTSFAHHWNVPFYGRLAVSTDATSFVGMDQQGSAWFVFR